MNSRRRVAYRVLLSLIAGGVACLFLEILLRIQAHASDRRNRAAWESVGKAKAPPQGNATLHDVIRRSPNPRRVYELLPNLSVNFMGGRLTTNRDGYRGKACAAKKDGALRIVGLGDSCMFGWGVDDNQTYLALLANRLNAANRRRKCEILNLAVPGYNTAMEVEALKEAGLAAQPDIVFVHFVENDIGLPNFIWSEAGGGTAAHSYLLKALSAWFGGSRAAARADGLEDSPREVPEQYKDLAGEEAIRRAFRELKALSQEHDFRLIVLSNWSAPPFLAQLSEELDFPVFNLGAVMQQYMREHGIREYDGSVLTLSRRDPHYSPLAHELIADMLFRRLDELGLASPKGVH